MNQLGSSNQTLPAKLPNVKFDLYSDFHEQLFRTEIWEQPLQKFAKATGLSIGLFDDKINCRGHFTSSPIGQRLERAGFWQLGGVGASFDAQLAKMAMAKMEPVYSVQLEMFAQLAVPIVIQEAVIATFVIGWVPDRFADPVACNVFSKSIGAAPMEVWQLIRMQQPISKEKLELQGRMLETFAHPLVQQLIVQIEDRKRTMRAQILQEAAHKFARSATEAELCASMVNAVVEFVPFAQVTIEIVNPKGESTETVVYTDSDVSSSLPSRHMSLQRPKVISIPAPQGQTLGRILIGIPEMQLAEETLFDIQFLAAQLGTALQKASLIQALENERSALKGANVQLQHLHKMKDEFLATVSHELRTPLNAILGWAQILSDDDSNFTDFKTGLETIKRNAKNQSNLIEDLLDVSRIISGKMVLHRENIEATAILRQSLETVYPMTEARKQKVHLQISSAPIHLKGDATRITQIFWNLLSNASKFTPQGGDITVVLENAGHYFRFEVSDTGAGMSADFLPHVFNRFSQADGSYSRRHGGLGLGLAIVRHLVELHGGTVTAESGGVDRGSTFKVFLPQNTTDQELDNAQMLTKFPSPALPKSAHSLNQVKILLVDDEPDSLRLTRFVLEKCGAIVEMADTAEQAYQKLRDWHPDVLISDISMPEQTGYDLIRRIRFLSDEEGGRTPAIALTALASDEHRNLALNAGFQTHLAKPFEPNVLAASVLSLLKELGKSILH